jgi:hypothetical protein
LDDILMHAAAPRLTGIKRRARRPLAGEKS